MKKEIVAVPGVKPVKHLSRATRFGNLVFVAGTTGKNLVTGEMPADIAGQTRVTLENIKLVLEAAGTSLDNILKMTCYLADLAEKPAFDEVYIPYFPVNPPARACFQVGDLGAGVKVEIEAIACIPD
ncbi:MAG: RidA family protein [Chloroflexota bacterium]|jgi:2-iminobutanoate/2-iminopropanoate deaminase